MNRLTDWLNERKGTQWNEMRWNYNFSWHDMSDWVNDDNADSCSNVVYQLETQHMMAVKRGVALDK
jgi:hypothetical protein